MGCRSLPVVADIDGGKYDNATPTNAHAAGHPPEHNQQSPRLISVRVVTIFAVLIAMLASMWWWGGSGGPVADEVRSPRSPVVSQEGGEPKPELGQVEEAEEGKGGSWFNSVCDEPERPRRRRGWLRGLIC